MLCSGVGPGVVEETCNSASIVRWKRQCEIVSKKQRESAVKKQRESAVRKQRESAAKKQSECASVSRGPFVLLSGILLVQIRGQFPLSRVSRLATFQGEATSSKLGTQRIICMCLALWIDGIVAVFYEFPARGQGAIDASMCAILFTPKHESVLNCKFRNALGTSCDNRVLSWMELYVTAVDIGLSGLGFASVDVQLMGEALRHCCVNADCKMRDNDVVLQGAHLYMMGGDGHELCQFIAPLCGSCNSPKKQDFMTLLPVPLIRIRSFQDKTEARPQTSTFPKSSKYDC